MGTASRGRDRCGSWVRRVPAWALTTCKNLLLFTSGARNDVREMTRAKTRKDRWEWLKDWFPARDIGWRVLFLLVTLVGLGGITSVWLWARGPAGNVLDALADSLNAELNLWQGLIFTFVVAAGLGIVVWWRRGSTRPISPIYSDEILYGGVLWPVRAGPLDSTNHVTRFDVGKPMCPKCRTPLSLLGVDEHGNIYDDVVIPLSETQIDDLKAQRMVFYCPHDHTDYDLRDAEMPMGWLKRVVSDLAMGQHRSARAAQAAMARRKR